MLLINIILLIIIVFLILELKPKTQENMEMPEYEKHRKYDSIRIGNYYNMISDANSSNNEKCVKNTVIRKQLNSGLISSSRLDNLSNVFDIEVCGKGSKDTNRDGLDKIYIFGDKQPLKNGTYEYTLVANNNKEPKIVRKNIINSNEPNIGGEASIILLLNNKVYVYKSNNNQWYLENKNTWIGVDDKFLLNRLSNMAISLISKKKTLGEFSNKKIDNEGAVIYLEGDAFPIKATVGGHNVEYTINNSKIRKLNTTLKKVENTDIQAKIIYKFNNNVYVLDNYNNWFLDFNNKFVKISDIKTISDINSSFNSAYQSRLFADSINTSKNLNTLSLYYTIHDKQPLYVSDRKTGIGYLYSIDQSNNSILKTDLKSNKDIALNLKFDRIIILNNKIYARTIQGNWLQEISQTLETRFSNTSLEESKTVENEWNNILQSIDKSKKNYIQSIDQAQVKYKGELINISNGFLIYDESGTLYAKLNDSEPYKKVLGNNKYELIPGNDVAIKLKQLDGLKKKYDDILKSQSTYQANDMALPLKSNSFLYKIDNKGVLSKNNKPYNPVFYILLNTESGVAIKTSDNNWLLESNGYFYGVPEAKYKEYNNYLITAMAVKNSNKYRNTVGTINNLEQCSNSESCVNKHAYCRTGSELCMYDDECQFKYRENTPEQRKLLCEKMLKNVAWFICSNPDNEIKSNNVPIILPNTIYDDTFVKPCYSVMTETNSNCVTVLGIHNLFQLLINLERLAISSKDLTAAPAHIEITQSPNEIYKLVVTSWNRNSVLFDIDSRRTVADKLEIKPLSLENLRFGASSKLDLILLKQ